MTSLKFRTRCQIGVHAELIGISSMQCSIVAIKNGKNVFLVRNTPTKIHNTVRDTLVAFERCADLSNNCGVLSRDRYDQYDCELIRFSGEIPSPLPEQMKYTVRHVKRSVVFIIINVELCACV